MTVPAARPLDRQAGLYETGIGKFNDYELRPGVCVLPLAEDPPTSEGELSSYSPVVILRLHAPYRIRKMTNSSRKTNNPPVLPSPEDAGAFVFVGGAISVVTSLNSSLANFDWTVQTAFFYVERCVSRVQDGFVLGSYQAPSAMAAENATSVGLNLFQPASQLPPLPSSAAGAVRQAGADARIGYQMSQSINFYGVWGYNQDAYLPGRLFNPGLVNGDVSPRE